MSRKATKTEKAQQLALRRLIRTELRSLSKENKPLDRNAIKAKYGGKYPTLIEYINSVVDGNCEHLESKRADKKVQEREKPKATDQSPQSPPKAPKALKALKAQPASTKKSAPKTTAASSSSSNALPKLSSSKAPSTGSFNFGVPPSLTFTTKENFKFNISPSLDFSAQGSVKSDSSPPAEPRDDSATSFDLLEDFCSSTDGSSTDGEDSDNAILQDFKDHLATGKSDKNAQASTDPVPATPSLEEQMQFLNCSEDDNELTSSPLATNVNHSVLLSPSVEKAGLTMPSQFALLGRLVSGKEKEKGKAMPDTRVMLNSNVPFSAFVCGLQGSGKSHTTSCIIENCSMALPALGSLKKSVSTLVLHFNEYSSNVSSQPSEAAFLAAVMPEYGAKIQPIPLRVLVSPTNYRNLAKMYSQIPNVKILPFKLQPRHLNISMMLSLMSMSQTDSMPLYMSQVTRVLRVMAMESGGHFDYADFRTRLSALRLDRAQTPFLYQRLDLLDSYLDLTGEVTGDYFVDGGVTILDLSCPFVDQSTACILFRIAIDLFLYAHPSRGKMIVADEAHKYMTDTAAAKQLTETFLTIIRQQRHLGVRTVISTQEPTISPKLIDLCSVTIVHRFTSPEWYRTIQNHVPIDKSKHGNAQEGIPDGLYRIASLRTGEALVFAPSAYLLDEEQTPLDTKHRMFQMTVRKRITWDGGRTITTVR